MNRGTRMSSALALVSPRRVDESTDSAQGDCLVSPRHTDGAPAVAEPAAPALAVVAQVPDMDAPPASQNSTVGLATDSTSSSSTSSRSWKPHWNPNWKSPLPKFRMVYVKAAAALVNIDLAACWAWAVSLPPIVKLGTVMASLVMSLWMFSGGDSDAPVETSPPAWHQDGETFTQYSAAKDGDEAPKFSAVAGRGEMPADASHVAHDHARSTGPSMREIQEAAGAARTSGKFDDRWPDEIANDERVAVANVRPIPSHREPYSRDEMPIDATPRGGVVGREVDGNARQIDAGPQPPADMPRRWAERSQPTHTSEYSPVQVNPYYADTAVARTPRRTIDARPGYDRPENRLTDDGASIHRTTNDRFADRRFADDRHSPRESAERAEAERRAYDDERARAYRVSRDRAHAEPHYESETYRR